MSVAYMVILQDNNVDNLRMVGLSWFHLQCHATIVGTFNSCWVLLSFEDREAIFWEMKLLPDMISVSVDKWVLFTSSVVIAIKCFAVIMCFDCKESLCASACTCMCNYCFWRVTHYLSHARTHEDIHKQIIFISMVVCHHEDMSGHFTGRAWIVPTMYLMVNLKSWKQRWRCNVYLQLIFHFGSQMAEAVTFIKFVFEHLVDSRASSWISGCTHQSNLTSSSSKTIRVLVLQTVQDWTWENIMVLTVLTKNMIYVLFASYCNSFEEYSNNFLELLHHVD